ncbi:hypothetical protein HY641_04880 [Candidatus Woesearchaeota archaeon]|nr:hypothetical protein [Candidatus Woesearchaeota archaeon]
MSRTVHESGRRDKNKKEIRGVRVCGFWPMRHWVFIVVGFVIVVGISVWSSKVPVTEVIEQRTAQCVEKSNLDALCVALASANSSACDAHPSAEDCKALSVMVRMIDGTGSCEDIIDPEYAAVCNAVERNQTSLCPYGEEAIECQAIIMDDSSLCSRYPQLSDQEVCKGHVHWVQALRANEESLCAYISDVTDMMACTVTVTKNPQACPLIKSAICRSIAEEARVYE